MKVYYMKLDANPFKKIKDLKKTLELRLFDDKRRKLDLGDYIVFSNRSCDNEKIAVKIKALFRASTFEELLKDISISMLGNSANETIDEVLHELKNYYSNDKELLYGVLGIKIEVVALEEVFQVEEQNRAYMLHSLFPDGMK